MCQRGIKNVVKFYILFLFTYCNAGIYIANTETAHLENVIIKDICGKINNICLPSYMQLCAVRIEKGKLQSKEFDNNCFLFLYNMCLYPGKEWAIKDMGSCRDLNLRRFAEKVENDQPTNNNVSELRTDGNIETLAYESTTDVTEAMADGTEAMADDTEAMIDGTEQMTDGTEQTGDNTELANNETTVSGNSEFKLALRTQRTTYGVEEAPDGHSCPYHCPDVYSPVCVNVNRGEGKYYRLLFFVNHCEADRHYCLHWETEYQPPPNEEYEMVRPPSNAAWSYCAGNKYMNFATFAESASSMGHYGWLMGDQKPSHIMEPYERVPGYG